MSPSYQTHGKYYDVDEVRRTVKQHWPVQNSANFVMLLKKNSIEVIAPQHNPSARRKFYQH